jgi:hypothetical protein
MNQPSDIRHCETCGKPAMQGLTQCGLCLAESILRERNHGGSKSSPGRKAAAKKKSNLVGAFLVVAFIVATISGILMLNSSGRAFKNAQKRDTVAAYESFLKNHGDSEHAAAARGRAAVLDYAMILEYPNLEGLRDIISKWQGSREEAFARVEIQRMANEDWQNLKASSDSRALRRFITDYPEAKEASQVSARIKELATLQAWELVRNGNDLQALANHAKEHKGHETARLATQRIEALCNDFDWVKRQDKLPIYRAYLEHNPNSPNKVTVEKRIIDLEVAEILAGKYGELPPSAPVRMTGGTEAQLEIENQTRHTLTLRYSGRQSYRFDLTAGETREVNLATDTYKVAATVSAPGVIPFAGSDTLQGGRYSSKFYIETRSR